jgi:hypothetical protein
MFKTTIAAAAAAVAFAPAAALAGPYVNVEANASWTGDNYTSTTTDVHVGYEGEVGAASYYVQAGPAIVAVDGVDPDEEPHFFMLGFRESKIWVKLCNIIRFTFS